MACLNTLKQEIKTIQSVFPRKPSSSSVMFQVLSASLDEITCRFIGLNGKKHDIHANITVNKVTHTKRRNIVEFGGAGKPKLNGHEPRSLFFVQKCIVCVSVFVLQRENGCFFIFRSINFFHLYCALSSTRVVLRTHTHIHTPYVKKRSLYTCTHIPTGCVCCVCCICDYILEFIYFFNTPHTKKSESQPETFHYRPLIPLACLRDSFPSILGLFS